MNNVSSNTLPAYGMYNGYGFTPETSQLRSVSCSSGYASDNGHYFKDKPRSQHPLDSVQQILKNPWSWAAIAGFLLIAWNLSFRAQRAWLLRELKVQSVDEAVQIWKKLDDEHREVTDELDHHYSMNEHLEERDEAWKHQVELLQNVTKKESRRAALDKYGKGPHRVQIHIQTGDTGPMQSFEVEMASVHYVPHAVHLFLEQVSHGLWNNAAFQVNEEHILQVGPASKEYRQHFKDYGLDKLAFPDYSDHFPHVKWTIGFAGRPGGPSWYINKLNNEEDHGPFGQKHHTLNEFADSCFAKIVSGFDVLEELFSQTKKTTIVEAKIVDWQDHWTDKDDEDWHTNHEELDSDSDDGEDDHHHPHDDQSPAEYHNLESYYTIHRGKHSKKPAHH